MKKSKEVTELGPSPSPVQLHLYQTGLADVFVKLALEASRLHNHTVLRLQGQSMHSLLIRQFMWGFWQVLGEIPVWTKSSEI